MNKMLPTQRTFLLAADQRLDSARRRKMTRKLRRQFVQTESWKAAGERSAAMLGALLSVVGLGSSEQELDIKTMQALRRVS